jgi:hypothetical protein
MNTTIKKLSNGDFKKEELKLKFPNLKGKPKNKTL